MASCSACGHQNAPEEGFCEKCGSWISQTPTEPGNGGQSLPTEGRGSRPTKEGIMPFIIKALIVGVVIVILYFIISPYHTCMRGAPGASRVFCWTQTNISW
jgi:uncharacterized membrane protein YvbJ